MPTKRRGVAFRREHAHAKAEGMAPGEARGFRQAIARRIGSTLWVSTRMGGECQRRNWTSEDGERQQRSGSTRLGFSIEA